ncbi:HAD-IC family P-type ATPase [Pseudactinotalea sp. HY158]|uniref:HAD-IC family P-type ATPase n=1 Tax=Pseudactinotalea sp. HY158 TaxID=2654547 RepID=UPI00129CC2DE|nr:HAD-IC family P-type ATPase [Pseudactinotalea sp. HY158]QGH69300.1 HAD-IC family P-type ATPase [Pseudactinotalea sp. HY158]
MNTLSATGRPSGLSASDVVERVAAGQVNRTHDVASRGLWDILRGNLFTLFNAMLGTALVLVLVVGAWRDAVFGGVIISNTLIGAITELRAKRALDRLAILDRGRLRVLRDGRRTEVELEEIVLDDLVLLSTGDQVPADGRVLDSTGLELDESMLTGESDPVSKPAGAELYSGAAVVAGSGLYRVTKVGADGYAQRITAEAKRFSLVGSELRDGINRILVIISWIIVPMALLLFWSQLRAEGGAAASFADGTWRDAVVQAVAGIVGMVPEGLVLLTSINFALAALILARRSVLVQELPAVEVLARVDVLCLDKTGTITDGSIALDAIVPIGPGDPAELGRIRAVLAGIAGDPEANPTARAMAPALEDVAPAALRVLVPFSSARKWSSAFDGETTWYFGAPEVLVAGLEDAGEVVADVRERAAAGARVLLLARAPGQVREPGGDLRPVALAAMRERVRPDAAETLRYFERQGVRVKVLSGDNPRTVAAIATSVGLEADGGVDARTLTAESTAAMLRDHHVFGRVSPEQKRQFVHALQADGHTVAMTGDGVNDALALKDADLGIAMGSGAAATKAVARLVLVDGRFSELPGVVAQGRRVIANMERVAALFLAKTTYAVLLALTVALVSWPYPFLPRHLTIVGTLTIGTPAFLLALAPNTRRYRPGFLGRVLKLAIPCGVVAAAAVLAVYGTLHLRGSEAQASTAATLTLVLIGLWLLGALARPLTPYRMAVVAAMTLGAAGALLISPIRHFFALEIPTPGAALLVLVAAVIGCALVEVIYRWRERRARPGGVSSGAPTGARTDAGTGSGRREWR